MKFKRAGENYVSFMCPGCDDHHVIPVKPHEKGWTFNGDFEKPTISPSLLVHPHGVLNDDGSVSQTPRCHSYVRDGRIEYLGDCTHALAGKTVELPEFE